MIVESYSSNAVSWVSQKSRAPWKFFYILNEIRVLSSSLRVVFKHVVWSANTTVDLLAKQGVDKDGPWYLIILVLFLCMLFLLK